MVTINATPPPHLCRPGIRDGENRFGRKPTFVNAAPKNYDPSKLGGFNYAYYYHSMQRYFRKAAAEILPNPDTAHSRYKRQAANDPHYGEK